MNDSYQRFPNARISPSALIEDDVEIGDGAIVEAHCSIHNGARIGARCHVRSGSRLGTEPFDFRITASGINRRKTSHPLIVGEGCEIGHNVVIQNGVERSTVIGANCMINNLCNIGHDIHIGDGSIVGLSTSISGYTTIGEGAEISPGVTISNRITLGKHVTVGIGSLVLHDFADDATVLGRPAVVIEAYKEERRRLKEALFGDYQPSKISSSRNRWQKLLKRLIRRFV